MNTDPITLAHEFLGPDEDGVPFDPDVIDPEWARRIVAPLARAVLRVADLADKLDEAGKRLTSMGVHATDQALYAARIRDALNNA